MNRPTLHLPRNAPVRDAIAACPRWMLGLRPPMDDIPAASAARWTVVRKPRTINVPDLEYVPRGWDVAG